MVRNWDERTSRPRPWPVHEAKARFSELVKSAEQAGPQEVTLHGRPVAVVLSRADYDRLAATGESLVELMRRSPLFGLDEVDLTRDEGLPRPVDL